MQHEGGDQGASKIKNFHKLSQQTGTNYKIKNCGIIGKEAEESDATEEEATRERREWDDREVA